MDPELPTACSGSSLVELLDALPTPVFVVERARGELVHANPAAGRVWGPRPDWLLETGRRWARQLPEWVRRVPLPPESEGLALLIPSPWKIPLEQAELAPWAVHWELCPRHARVAMLISKGHTDREIGEALGVSWSTARTYAGQVLRAADVRRRTELMHAMCRLQR